MNEPIDRSAPGSFPGPTAYGPGMVGMQPPGLTIGQILDRVFSLLRANLRLYLGIAVVPSAVFLAMIAMILGSIALSLIPRIQEHPAKPDLHFFYWLVPLVLLLYIAMFLVYAIYAAASSYAVVQTNLGQSVTAVEAWAVARQRAGSFIWLMFLVALIIAGPVYLAFGVCGGSMALFALGTKSGAMPLQFFAFVPLVALLGAGAYVYMILMFLRYCLAFPASVMENLRVAHAIRRSVALTRGAKGRIFVVLLVMYAATYVIVLVCEMLMFFVGSMAFLAGSALQFSIHSPVVLFLLAPLAILLALVVLVLAIALPYAAYSAALGVLYCDQKFRLDSASALRPAGEPV